MATASDLAHPALKFLTYKNDDEMKSFYEKVIQEANTTYHFPMTLTQIKTSPQIFAVNPQLITEPGHEGVFPIVKYLSTIQLTDTIALGIENNALQKQISTVFKNIYNENECIIYQAFNQLPDGKNLVKHYGFIQKLK